MIWLVSENGFSMFDHDFQWNGSKYFLISSSFWSDAIVLAGTTALEVLSSKSSYVNSNKFHEKLFLTFLLANQEFGVPATKPFCGGRTDASNDDGYSDFLKVVPASIFNLDFLKNHQIKSSIDNIYSHIRTHSQSCMETSRMTWSSWRRWSGWWGLVRCACSSF